MAVPFSREACPIFVVNQMNHAALSVFAFGTPDFAGRVVRDELVEGLSK